MTYETQPGTIPHRAYELFKAAPKGTEHSTAELADLLGQPPSSMTAVLASVRKHGFLKCRTRADTGKILYWSLGDGVPEPEAEDHEEDEPLEPRSPVKTRRRTRADHQLPFPKIDEPSECAKSLTPLFCAYSDGRLGIQSEGQAMMLSGKSTAALKKFLSEWGGPAE